MRKQRALLVLLLVLVLFNCIYTCQRFRSYKEAVSSLSDTLKITRDELEQERARIKVLKFERQKDFLRLKTKDSTIRRLQELVRHYKGLLNTAIILSNQTNDEGVTPAVITHYDTVYISENETIYFPTYQTRWDGRWSKGEIIATKDSIYRNIKIRNEYKITIGNIRNGWFKRKEYEIEVLNLNPYTYTTELLTYQLKEEAKKVNFSTQLGYGINLLTYKPVFYIGLGANYRILGIK